MCSKSDTSGVRLLGTGDEDPQILDFRASPLWVHDTVIENSHYVCFLSSAVFGGLAQALSPDFQAFNEENPNTACRELDRSNSTVLLY